MITNLYYSSITVTYRYFINCCKNCLVYMNTLMVQEVLYDNNQYWLKKMTPEDFRGLTPLFYHHVNPYGTFELDMDQRIPIKLKVS